MKSNRPRTLSGKAGRTLSQMPPLAHRPTGEHFDADRSEVFRWMSRQPEILQWAFDKARDVGRIVYDREKRTWCGVAYDQQDPDNVPTRPQEAVSQPTRPNCPADSEIES